jgi:hypothetical protein
VPLFVQIIDLTGVNISRRTEQADSFDGSSDGLITVAKPDGEKTVKNCDRFDELFLKPTAEACGAARRGSLRKCELSLATILAPNLSPAEANADCGDVSFWWQSGRGKRQYLTTAFGPRADVGKLLRSDTIRTP